jgi:hypothetical protein
MNRKPFNGWATDGDAPGASQGTSYPTLIVPGLVTPAGVLDNQFTLAVGGAVVDPGRTALRTRPGAADPQYTLLARGPGVDPARTQARTRDQAVDPAYSTVTYQ